MESLYGKRISLSENVWYIVIVIEGCDVTRLRTIFFNSFVLVEALMLLIMNNKIKVYTLFNDMNTIAGAADCNILSKW